MVQLLTWVSDYYCYPIGEVIKMAVPKAYVLRQMKPSTRKTNKTTDFSFKLSSDTSLIHPLTSEQQLVLDKILSSPSETPFLLHGVTGSGKTEVYIKAIESCLSEGKGAILLVPEIALTPQMVGRFSVRFPGKIAVLHRDLTPREKAVEWEKAYSGQAQIVIGARSAIFSPVKHLGLIIVDEEHESSFKQDDSVRYHARDVAVVRALGLLVHGWRDYVLARPRVAYFLPVTAFVIGVYSCLEPLYCRLDS
jgi:primosomal protein N' (replication factor Y)